MAELRTILAPLVRVCEAKGLRWQWETLPEEDGWRANVTAGYADADWKPTGALPCWTAHRQTEAAALARAVDDAISYWDTMANNGLH